jgi:hypothetical protein
VAGDFMGMTNKDWIILGFISIVAFVYWLYRRPRRVSGQKVGKANSKARSVLEEAGYEILNVKPTVTVQMDIDGKAYPFELKSDFLVSRSSRKYLVRIRKNGKQARLQSKLWRGTHLRDVLAFRADGILVLNVEKETLNQVRFRI